MKVSLIIILLIASLSAGESATARNAVTGSHLRITAQDLKIKGNKNSRIYHLPGCASYNAISPKNIVWFKTEAEATAAGYRKARNC
jgi:methylphosphotriester-DNA--protein-cysteine methyltransferase